MPLPHPEPDPVVAAHPVGQVIKTAHGPDGLATATYDPTEQWRFRLSRVWDTQAPRCVFVMLNPSTATETELDPTVRRCVTWARDWGYGALEVVNIFAYRATDPKAMKSHPHPVGDGNDEAVLAAARHGDLTVAAWGTHGKHLGRGPYVATLLNEARIAVTYLHLTKAGHPGHPLYLPGSSTPQPWGQD